ncbi:MAG: Crp/Fnr family transcriptional regulator [Flavobacteriaceae bacterium]|nr:Crp/Fnr family transcriptional regulator [Flavobacteriaceae bacterium]
MENLFDYMKSLSPLSQKSEIELRKISSKKKYSKKTILCKIGQIPKKAYFIEEGLIRSFMISPKGNEYNRSFFIKGEFTAAFTSLIHNTPSLYTIECLTDCTFIEFDYKKLITLMETYNDIGIIYRKYIENLYVFYTNRNIDFLTLNATQRYLNLRKRIPQIDAIISQKKIAGHLAITKVQLNRIRRKLLTT